MSKGTRKREAAAIRRIEEERRQQAQQKKAKRNKIILSCVAAVAVVGIVIGAFAIVRHKRANDPDYQLHNTLVATSDNYEVTQAMMTYFMRSTYMNFVGQNEAYLEQMELSTEIPLKSQTCYFSEDITWFDYFAETTKDSVNWMLGFAEEAKANGLSLTEEDNKAIEDTLKQVSPSNFGEYITKDDIRACLELYYMADKQEAKVQKDLVATDADVKAFADKHNQELLQADVAYYGITYGGSNPYADKATAEELANKLMNASTEEFEKILKEELVRRKLYTEETIEDGYEPFCVQKGYTYAESDGFSKWLFAGNVKAGDTYKFEEGKDTIVVVQCLTEPARDNDRTVDVRHILFKSDTHGDSGAKKKAEDLLAEWKAGEATEESFAELAKKHTEDVNPEQGGLYEGVYPGQMVATFNDWCFDAARKPGDTDVVKTDYGYHVMYYVALGEEEMWYITARESYLDEVYETIYQGYVTNYHVDIVDEAVQAVDM